MKDEASVQKYLGVFNFIVSKLVALDVRIEDEDRASILLCSIPKS